MVDVIIPKNNEKEFIEIAEKLGKKKLIFLYELKEYKKIKLDHKTKIKLEKGLLLINNKELNKIPKDTKFVFVKNPTREMIENKKITHVFNLEDQQKADFIHHRNGGMNHVYAKIMRDHEKIYCFSYELLLNNKRKDQLIGRFSQNKKLTKKYKVKSEIYSFANEPYELRAKHERQALNSIL